MARTSTLSKQPADCVSSHCKMSGSQDTHDRDQTLADLLPLWAGDLTDTSYAGRVRVLAQLQRALRKERQRGRSGHWSYNLARHRALLDTYRREADVVRQQSPSHPRAENPASQ